MTGGENMNYITIKDVCERLQVSRQAIYDWRKQGMPCYKFGKLVRFDYEEVKEWLQNR